MEDENINKLASEAVRVAFEWKKNLQAAFGKAHNVLCKLQEVVDKKQEEADRAEAAVDRALAAVDDWKEQTPEYRGDEIELHERNKAVQQANNRLKDVNDRLKEANNRVKEADECLKEAYDRVKEANADLIYREKHLLSLQENQQEHELYDKPKKKCPKWDVDKFQSLVGAVSDFSRPVGKGSWTSLLRESRQQLLCHKNNDDLDRIPVTLLSNFFTEFSNDCETIEVGASDCNFFTKLMYRMQAIYDKEAERQESFIELFEGYTGHRLQPTIIVGSQSDGSLFENGFIYCNLEVKNEKSLTGCDSYFPNIGYYVTKLRQGEECQQPCVLLQLNDCNFGVSGIINSRDLILCDPLSPTYDLTKIVPGSETSNRLLRLFPSLKKLLGSLQSYYFYKRFKKPSDLPYSCPIKIGDETRTLSFVSVIQRLTFIGYLEEEKKEVIAKFSENYGVAVHDHCNHCGFSPKLLSVSRLMPNMSLVVMEKVIFRELQREDAYRLESQFQELLKCLQDKGYVHGDLRPCNIKVDELRNKILVLDFDWAGVHGKDVYPPFMNPEIPWPEGASSGQPLKFAHDEECINRVVEWAST